MRSFLLLVLAVVAPRLAAQPMAIADARQQPVGTVVTIAGFITVANEFGGPAYLQDGTAGIAVYLPALHAAAAVGDSVVVTGPLADFQATSGQPGTGLLEISGSGTTYQLFKAVNRPQAPRIVSVADLSEALEGQLVRIPNASIGHSGAFSQNTNYTLSDATGDTELRIDNSTDLVGAQAPQGPVDVIGVVSEFRGTRQVMPRTTADLGVESIVIPGEEVPRSATFEVGTWNLRWFGDPNERPDDDALQFQNAVRVLRTMQPDVMALQEIVNADLFAALVDSLPGYRGFIAPISQAQKTAFVYNTATVDSVDAGFYLTSGDWASRRYPYAFTFDAHIGGETVRLTAINVHFKATLSSTASTDYDRRKVDALQLKQELDRRNPNDAVLVLGDFNDDVDLSTVLNRPSPYAAFVADTAHYRFLTASLSARGYQSISGGQMIDHILVTDEVLPYYFEGTERVENTQYVGSYLSTTSDHYPVWVRLEAGTSTASTPLASPTGVALAQPWPLPTQGAVSSAIYLPTAAQARLEVFDLMGRRVQTVFDGTAQQGRTPVRIAGDGLSAGVYVLRLTAAGQVVTRSFVVL